MSFRLMIGGVEHETNQDGTAPTVLDDFLVSRGDDDFDGVNAGRTYVRGMFDAAQALGADIVGVQHAIALPSGTIDGDAYQQLKVELIARIRAALPLDAIALALHGAA